MPDPTEIAVISSALPATLAFIFQRAERLLSRRGSEPETVSVPDSLLGTLQLPLQPDADELLRHRDRLLDLRDGLAIYAQGGAPVRSTDQPLLRNLNRLRAALENIYGQRLTFEGEDRPASGPFVEQKFKEVSGKATGMDAHEIGGSAHVIQDVETVTRGGEVTGMKGYKIRD